MEIGNNPSAQTQKEILDKLGIKSASDVVNESSDKLGQEDFLDPDDSSIAKSGSDGSNG